MKSVLIIEDNPTMLHALEDNFSFKGYKVRLARDGEQGLKAALAGQNDLIILDIMLPKINGFELCSKLRQRKLDVPILMLTAKDAEDDIVMGLNLGADDYVTKPFSIKELLARAEALLRRRAVTEPDDYEFGNCRVNISSEKLVRNGSEVKLRAKEFALLRVLLSNRGCVLSNEQILHGVFGYSHFISAKDIAGYVKTLRQKIEDDADRPSFIHTVAGAGYRFELSEDNGDSSDS